jgi:hypothetical protein
MRIPRSAIALLVVISLSLPAAASLRDDPPPRLIDRIVHLLHRLMPHTIADELSVPKP